VRYPCAASSSTSCLRLGDIDDLAWLYLSHAGPAGVAAWPDRLKMPDRLLSILTLLGNPDDDSLSRWSLGEAAAEIFSEWLGIPMSYGVPASEDKAQAEVIEAPIDARLLIVAGPGSGKTWTACSRISAALQSATGGSISEKEFFEIYTGLHPFPGRPSLQAWKTLRRVSGDERGGVDLARLAEVMKSKAPVAEIAISDIGPRSAPLFSTIHAAKGREAEIVVLGLAGTMQAQTEEETLEEARVLYVGATRASKQLRIGAYPKGMKTLPGSSKRNWRAWNGNSGPAAYVELGLPGDVEPTASVTGAADLEGLNFLLWQRSQKTSKAMLKLKGGRYQIILDSDGEGRVLGSLSTAFTSDLKTIGKQLTGWDVFPSARIEGLFIVGSSSVVTTDNSSALRFSLAPILAGTPLVFFNRT